MELQRRRSTPDATVALQPVEVVNSAMVQIQPAEIDGVPIAEVVISPEARLVALTDPHGLGAEKFRALATRLDHQRSGNELRSLQVTSVISGEGKTLVAGNLALTLAKEGGKRVLLVEGDLHCPSLATLLGLGGLTGIGHWWSAREEKEEIAKYVRRLRDLPVWFLAAGASVEHPSQVLQSSRFAQTFVRLASWFDWVVIDSTPMIPIIDTSLWSRLVDGSLMVVREGVTPIKALKRGLAGMDNPKFVGVVLNEASEFDHTNYSDRYYGLYRPK
jgi:capsular exopolysaccharide synthesis family protein